MSTNRTHPEASLRPVAPSIFDVEIDESNMKPAKNIRNYKIMQRIIRSVIQKKIIIPRCSVVTCIIEYLREIYERFNFRTPSRKRPRDFIDDEK